MTEQRSLIILKPDAIHRNLFADFCQFLKIRNLEIAEYSMIKSPDPRRINEHYAEHVDKDWYPELFRYMHGGPIIVIAVYGNVKYIREECMNYRNSHKLNERYNTVHSSDSEEAAERELKIWGMYP